MSNWYDRPLDQRATPPGETGLDGHYYKAGEFMPFYVSRTDMPQINECDYPALIHYAATFGVEHRMAYFECATLHVHQQVDAHIVAGIESNPATLKSPCLISGDLYILDGNHRYWAHYHNGSLVPGIQFMLPFPAAIQFLFRFPRTYRYGVGGRV